MARNCFGFNCFGDGNEEYQIGGLDPDSVFLPWDDPPYDPQPNHTLNSQNVSPQSFEGSSAFPLPSLALGIPVPWADRQLATPEQQQSMSRANAGGESLFSTNFCRAAPASSSNQVFAVWIARESTEINLLTGSMQAEEREAPGHPRDSLGMKLHVCMLTLTSKAEKTNPERVLKVVTLAGVHDMRGKVDPTLEALETFVRAQESGFAPYKNPPLRPATLALELYLWSLTYTTTQRKYKGDKRQREIWCLNFFTDQQRHWHQSPKRADDVSNIAREYGSDSAKVFYAVLCKYSSVLSASNRISR